MINVAVYQKTSTFINLEVKCTGIIKNFSHHKIKDCVYINESNKNKLNEIKKFFKNEPFLLLFSDEKLTIDLPENINQTHVCLAVDNFLIKTQRIYNVENKGVEKIIIKSLEENIFSFNDKWKQIDKSKDKTKSYCEFLFGEKMSEEHLYVYFQTIKFWLKNKVNLVQAENWINILIKKYPLFLEIPVLTGCFFYEENNLYKALMYFELAQKITNDRNLYDLYPMAPKYHKTILENMIKNTKELIKKFDPTH